MRALRVVVLTSLPVVCSDVQSVLIASVGGDLIDVGQFVEACTLWTARKHTRLADLLVERGWIVLADKTHLDYLLERKLANSRTQARRIITDESGEPIVVAAKALDLPADVVQITAASRRLNKAFPTEHNRLLIIALLLRVILVLVLDFMNFFAEL